MGNAPNSSTQMTATFFFRADEEKSQSATSFQQVSPSGQVGFTLLQTAKNRR